MLAVISPSKTLPEEKLPLLKPVTNPEFLERTAELGKVLKGKSTAQLKKLMDISDKLAELNHQRFQAFDPDFTDKNTLQAIRAFQGDVYVGLDVDTLSSRQLDSLNRQVRILSGFYGLLKPYDRMQPYRLEMGIPLKTNRKKDLYAFWGDTITAALNAELEAGKHTHLLNLASQEYFKAVQPKNLVKPLITIEFKEKKGKDYKTIALFAKKARGMYARFMAMENPSKLEDLKAFSAENYHFQKSLSSDTTYVFVR